MNECDKDGRRLDYVLYFITRILGRYRVGNVSSFTKTIPVVSEEMAIIHFIELGDSFAPSNQPVSRSHNTLISISNKRFLTTCRSMLQKSTK